MSGCPRFFTATGGTYFSKFVGFYRASRTSASSCERVNGGGCSRRLNHLCQGFPVSGNYTGNLSAFSARDLTVSGEKHRIKQRFYPVEVTARGSGTANSGQIIREFRSNCRDSPGSISRVPCLPALALNSRQPELAEGEDNREGTRRFAHIQRSYRDHKARDS